MQTVSSLTDYRHHNIYVMRSKLLLCIQGMKQLLREQYHTKVIQVPPYILLEEIQKASKLLKHTDEQIMFSEQHVFRFGS